jgi:hypothetical protein
VKYEHKYTKTGIMNSEVALQAPAAVKAVRELTDDEINELQLPLPK